MAIRDVVSIKQDIDNQLVWDDQVLSDNVSIKVSEDGTAILSGKVASLAAKRAAEADAWSVYGVTSVENSLEVEFPSALEVPTDDDIEKRVADSLLWNPVIDSANIEVSVEAGIVTLEGSVDAFWKKLRVETLASNVTGVLSVENKLAVVPTKDFVDQDIADDIVDSIDRKLAVNVENVDVKVSDGKVTLAGTVPSFTAWSAAYDSARYTAGVKDVEDRLTIEY